MAFRAFFLDIIFDQMGVLLDHRMLIIDVVIHTGGLQTTMAKKQPNLTRLDLRLQVEMKYILS